MRETIKKLVQKSFFSARLLHQIRCKRETARLKQLIFIYQMGKVGSSTVVRSLKAINLQAFNVHTFDPFFLNQGHKLFRKEFYTTGTIPQTLWDQQFLKKYFVDKPSKKPIRIVTLVRDPVARNISLFFQWPNMIMEKKGDGYHIRSLSFNYDRLFQKEGIEKELEKLFISQFKLHDRPLAWFDKELYRYFDIDVYHFDFPKEKGYFIYRNGNVEVILIKLEKLADVAHDAFNEFLGIESFELIEANIGEKKNTSELYSGFLSSTKLSMDYLDRMYNSRFARHFYTKEELDRFRSRWS